MIVIETPLEWTGKISYRDIKSDIWYKMDVDLETFACLITYYGVISTIGINPDNPSTGKDLRISYYGAEICIQCKNPTSYHLGLLALDGRA